MPNKGPHTFSIGGKETETIKGFVGPPPDNQPIGLNLKPGDEVTIKVEPEQGCVTISAGGSTVYAPLPNSVLNLFTLKMPAIRILLTAQEKIDRIDEWPEFIKDSLNEMLEENS